MSRKCVFHDVRQMHIHYGINVPSHPTMMDEETERFRTVFLEEELEEFKKACIEKNLPDQIDALIDLIVVAAGTLDFMGVIGELHWDEVHSCNMKKEVVTNASESKRGSAIDLKKPDGWVPPDHESLLDLAIYHPENEIS